MNEPALGIIVGADCCKGASVPLPLLPFLTFLLLAPLSALDGVVTYLMAVGWICDVYSQSLPSG